MAKIIKADFGEGPKRGRIHSKEQVPPAEVDDYEEDLAPPKDLIIKEIEEEIMDIKHRLRAGHLESPDDISAAEERLASLHQMRRRWFSEIDKEGSPQDIA